MDYVIVRRELIRAIRGKLTQGQLSRRLGYRTNQVYRWEAGRQSIRWSEFVVLCRLCKADLGRALSELLKFEGDPKDAALLVKHFIGKARILDFTRKSGLSRFRVSRWLSGRSEPSLDEMLELIELAQKGLFDFAFRLSFGRELPSFRDRAEAKRRYLELFQRFPWVSVVRMCIDVADYQSLPKHRPGHLAKKLGISVEDESFLLAELERAGSIRMDKGKYRLVDLGINVRGDPRVEVGMVRAWSEQAASIYERMQAKPRASRFHLLVFSASKEAAERIESEVNALYSKVRSILSEDPGPTEEIKVLNMQLLDRSEMHFGTGS